MRLQRGPATAKSLLKRHTTTQNERHNATVGPNEERNDFLLTLYIFWAMFLWRIAYSQATQCNRSSHYYFFLAFRVFFFSLSITSQESVASFSNYVVIANWIWSLKPKSLQKSRWVLTLIPFSVLRDKPILTFFKLLIGPCKRANTKVNNQNRTFGFFRTELEFEPKSSNPNRTRTEL